MEGDESKYFYDTFPVNITATGESDDWGSAVKINGSVDISLTVRVKYYISWSRQYLEFTASPHVRVHFSIEGSIYGKITLGKFSIPVAPCVNVGMEPKIKLEFTGTIGLTANAYMVLGFSYDNETKGQNLSTKPTIKLELDVEGEIFLGIEFGPVIEIIDDELTKASLDLTTGFSITGKMTGKGYEVGVINPDVDHTCQKCIDLDIVFKAELEGKIRFLDADWLEFGVELGSWEHKIGKAYYSCDNKDFNLGACPNRLYRITFSVKNSEGSYIPGAIILTKTGKKLGTTNKKGVLVTYLSGGSYEINAITEDRTITKAVKIGETAFVCIVDSNASLGRVIASGKCGANVFWELHDAGVLRIYGSGAMANFSYYSMEPWEEYYDRIKTVVIESGVTSIGQFAFTYCNISNISLPDTLTSIEDYTFWYCVNLQGYWVDSNNPVYSNDEKGVLFDKNKKRLIRAPEGIKGHYSVPDSVTTIDWEAFRLCANLTSVTLPNSVTTIEPWAFNDCTSLTSITLSNKLTSIGYGAFWDCIKLSSITFPNSLTSIGSEAFWDCDNLISVTIPKNVTNISGAVFARCDNLQAIWVDQKNTKYSCDQLGILYDKNKKTLINAPGGMVGQCFIPEGVIDITSGAFYGCHSLTSVTIPSSVTSIGSSAFRLCDSLNVIFSGKAPSIESGSFYDSSVTAYYPVNDTSWTSEVMQNYGGNVSWVPYEVEVAQVSENMLADQMTSEIPQANAIFGSETSTDTTDTGFIQTATFTDLVPGEEYVMLALLSIDVDDPLAADNLLYINQAVAAEDGSLSFQYVLQDAVGMIHVIACGASNRNLENAQISVPNMKADGETQVVQPTVIYEGITLSEGVDYVLLGDVAFTEAGEYTCYIRGIRDYAGLVACTYSVKSVQNYAWEAADSAFASLDGNGYTYNDTTLLSGTYTGNFDTGTMSSVQYSLGETVTMMHDQPWVLEWKSGGNTYAGGIMLLNKDTDSAIAGNMYIHITQSDVFLGYRDNVGYNNSGITWNAIAEKLGSTAGANIRKEMLEFKIVNVPNGSHNKMWLYVNGVEIGTMDSSKMIGSDASHESVGNINISGKDFMFNYLGSATHTLNNCNISYIRVYEGGQPKSEAKPPLTLKSLPDQTTFSLGETLCLDGGVLEVNYPDGTSEEIPLADAELSYDVHKLGSVTVTASYEGNSTTFKITVRHPESTELTGHSFHSEGLWLTEIYPNDAERSKEADTRKANERVTVTTYDTNADLMEFVEVISTHEEDFQFNDVYALYYNSKQMPVVTLDGSPDITVKKGQPIVIWNERVDVTGSAIPDAATFRKEMHIPDSALILKTTGGFGWDPAATFSLKLKSTDAVFCTFTPISDSDVKDGMSVELKMPFWKQDTLMERYAQQNIPSPGYVYHDQVRGYIKSNIPENYNGGVFITEIRPNDASRQNVYGTGSDYMECLEIVNTTDKDVVLNEDLQLMYTYRESHRKPISVYQYSPNTVNHVGSSSDCIIPASGSAVIWCYRYDYLKATSTKFPTLAEFRNAYGIPSNVPVYLFTNQDGLNNTDRGFELYSLNDDGSLNLPVSSYFYNGSTDLSRGTSVLLKARHDGPGMVVHTACATSTIGTFLDSQVRYTEDVGTSVNITPADGFGIPEAVKETESMRILFDCHYDEQLPLTATDAYYRLDGEETWKRCDNVNSGATNQLEVIVPAEELSNHNAVEFYVTASNTYHTTVNGVYWVRINDYTTEEPPAFYLFGQINGQNYAYEEDYENMGEYKFDRNGNLSVFFNEDSYVAVKKEDNQDWYMTEYNCTAPFAILHNTTTCASGKMYVPAHTYVTFKLTDNNDDTLTLSYTTQDCPHEYNNIVRTEPTCTDAGYTIYTCSICGDTYTEDEVDALGHSFENGSCVTCGEVDPDYVKPVVQPTLTLKAPTLEFKDMICIITFYTAENIEDVVEMGMITYSEKVDQWSVETADHVIPGASYDAGSGRYYSSSQGIHAKYLSDNVYLAIYAKLSDGSYTYTRLVPYSPITYATNQLNNSTNTSLKQLVAAMLNYGAAAQTYFGHNTDSLANGNMTAEQLALPEGYRADMVQSVPAASKDKQGVFANNKGFRKRSPAVSFEGAFSINYFFTPAYMPVGEITFYYWSETDFNTASVLTAANATGSFAMTGEGMGQYRGDLTGIAAKNLSSAVYVAAVYTDGTNTWTTGVLGYSIGAYCASQAQGTGAMADLAMATAVYGYHAKQYFGS